MVDVGHPRDNPHVPSALKRLLGRLRFGRPTSRSPRPTERPSPPSPGFLGERIYYRDSRGRRVEAVCVDVSTDWVSLFDIEVIDRGEVVETHRGVRGYTALNELAQTRGWTKRQRFQLWKDAAAQWGKEPPATA